MGADGCGGGGTAGSVPAATAAILGVNAVTKRFGGLTALREVSLQVRPGEVCGLIGPNGAGKTTLFDIISGLTAPTAGAIHLDGVDVTRALPERRARAGVRRTFQRIELCGSLSVEDNVLTATEWRGGGGGLAADLVAAPSRRRREAQRRERVASVLDACGLSGLAGRPAWSLPTGAARLVELARAIVDEPRVLLLDEPTSGLSPGETARFGEQIQRLRAGGVAVLLVEHDISFVMESSDRVVVLDLGAVLAEGTPGYIQAHPDVRRAYLG